MSGAQGPRDMYAPPPTAVSQHPQRQGGWALPQAQPGVGELSYVHVKYRPRAPNYRSPLTAHGVPTPSRRPRDHDSRPSAALARCSSTLRGTASLTAAARVVAHHTADAGYRDSMRSATHGTIHGQRPKQARSQPHPIHSPHAHFQQQA